MAQRGRVEERRGGEGRSLGEGRGPSEFPALCCLPVLEGPGRLSSRTADGEGTRRVLERGRCCHRLLVLGNVVHGLPVTPRPPTGARGWQRLRVKDAAGVDRFRGRRSKGRGGRGVVCRAGSAWAPSSVLPMSSMSARSSGLLTPRPGRTSDVLYLVGGPGPFGASLSPGEAAPTLGARWETMPGALAAAAARAAGLERRGAPPRGPGGGRGHLSARLRRRRAGQPSPGPAECARPGPRLQRPRRARQGVHRVGVRR